MNFLADENFPLASSKLLIQHNYIVEQTSIIYRGKPEIFLLEQSLLHQQIILTFDKDFGELLFKKNISNIKGVILFRLQNYLPQTPGKIINDILLNQSLNFFENLTVIYNHKIRQRPIK